MHTILYLLCIIDRIKKFNQHICFLNKPLSYMLLVGEISSSQGIECGDDLYGIMRRVVWWKCMGMLEVNLYRITGRIILEYIILIVQCVH